jgi:hypothetical protein
MSAYSLGVALYIFSFYSSIHRFNSRFSPNFYMDAVGFPSRGQGCNGIVTSQSKRIKLIKRIKFWCAYKYQRVRFNLNQVVMQ